MCGDGGPRRPVPWVGTGEVASAAYVARLPESSWSSRDGNPQDDGCEKAELIVRHAEPVKIKKIDGRAEQRVLVLAGDSRTLVR